MKPKLEISIADMKELEAKGRAVDTQFSTTEKYVMKVQESYFPNSLVSNFYVLREDKYELLYGRRK